MIGILTMNLKLQ